MRRIIIAMGAGLALAIAGAACGGSGAEEERMDVEAHEGDEAEDVEYEMEDDMPEALQQDAETAPLPGDTELDVDD